MSKTLTEQWREGTLEQRYYYVKYFPTVGKPFVEIELKNFLLDLVKVKDRDKIEVLAPVPSYDEFFVLSDFKKIEKDAIDNLVKIHTEKLEKKLSIATKALKHYANTNTWCICNKLDCAYVDGSVACIALKEMEGVK